MMVYRTLTSVMNCHFHMFFGDSIWNMNLGVVLGFSGLGMARAMFTVK